MTQDAINEFRKQMENVGFCHRYTHLPLNQDIATFTFFDRSLLKEKKELFLTFSLSNLELMQGSDYFDKKICSIVYNYDSQVKDFGGFQRADMGI